MSLIESWAEAIVKSSPNLLINLKIAGIREKPVEYVKKHLKNSLLYAFILSVGLFMIVSKQKLPILLVPLGFVCLFIVFFAIFIKTADAKISKRAKEIDREIIYAGRYLLVKLNSGKPLINALIDASKSYGISKKYFKEIVREIELGTPIEKALDNAMIYSPSKKFKKILFQISNALKIGIDVSKTLEAVLEEISNDQLLEIQRYGKKLNSFTMFYMMFAVVVPSLGITMLIIVASMTDMFALKTSTFIIIMLFLLLIQIMFITMFKGIRPNIAV
ncbi:MAG: type II secretion system F family protein [Candidatus Woesearchaeota archaeon]